MSEMPWVGAAGRGGIVGPGEAMGGNSIRTWLRGWAVDSGPSGRDSNAKGFAGTRGC